VTRVVRRRLNTRISASAPRTSKARPNHSTLNDLS
jgi:hypothetical protein